MIGAQLKAPLKPLNTILRWCSKDIRGVSIEAPPTPDAEKDASLSDNCALYFFRSRQQIIILLILARLGKTPIWRTAVWGAGASRRHGGPLPGNLSYITALYRIEGFKGGPKLGHYYAERRQSLGQQMKKIPVWNTARENLFFAENKENETFKRNTWNFYKAR